jgi:osmotically-inducible protein OsmY
VDDKILRQCIIDELDFDPRIHSANIGVAVDGGIVTLTGHVPTYPQKAFAEQAVKRVKGVRGLAEELKVQFAGADAFSDEEIAKRAIAILDFNVLVPKGAVTVKVEKGWITLSGEVPWEYERTAATADLRKLRGVMGISNLVTVKPHATTFDVQQRITEALKRSAEVEARNVKVNVHDGRVTLEGHVDTWADRQAVERAAWSAPGVHAVEDHVHIA